MSASASGPCAYVSCAPSGGDGGSAGAGHERLHTPFTAGHGLIEYRIEMSVFLLLAALTAATAAQQEKVPLGPPPVPPPDPRQYQTIQVRVTGGGFPGKP